MKNARSGRNHRGPRGKISNPDPGLRGEEAYGSWSTMPRSGWRTLSIQMKPGSFSFDPAGGGTIYLWMNPPRTGGAEPVDPHAQWWENPVNLASDDPNQHQVEASVRDR